MELDFAYYGNPVLRAKAARIEHIDDELLELVRNMVDTLITKNGLGLAAPQINKSIRLFITAVPKQNEDGTWEQASLKIFINPEIIELSDEHDYASEGCLSIPGFHREIFRPVWAKVRATNLEGEIFEMELHGLDARCFLHENDHINGVLFIDRLDKKERKKLEPLLKEIKNKYN